MNKVIIFMIIKMNDNSAFVIWGEYDQQFNQKQLEQTISPLIKSYLTRN